MCPARIVVTGPLTERSPQVRCVDAPALDRFIQTGRECLVSILQQKFVILTTRKDFPYQMEGPLRRRVFGDIEVTQTLLGNS